MIAVEVREAVISSIQDKDKLPPKPPASRPRRYLPFAITAVAGFVVALVFAGGFASFVQYTNGMDFCISCHEMRSTVYEEYKQSTHFSSRSGVHPVCADCHVPHGSWVAVVLHKAGATKELFAHLGGKLDTQEKFEARRLELAQAEWARMKASDSAECRRCHSVAHWDLSLHKPRARAQHQDMAKNGETCIDCHKGIAHKAVHEETEKKEEEEVSSFELE